MVNHKQLEVIIIGGGIIGCSLGYNLARLGVQDLMILEKGDLGRGSTGRCAAGLRQQWGTEMNCILAKRSLELFVGLEEELGYAPGIQLKEGGYLILVHTEEEGQQARKNVALQNRLGIPSGFISPQEVQELVPQINTQGILGATYCPTDGHANPFHVIEAYAQAARNYKVSLCTFTEVLDIERKEGGYLLTTNEGTLFTPILINAAGGYSQEVAALLGIKLPTYSERHQILVTEPLEFFLEPMVVSFKEHIYCQQTPHGSFLMGMGDPAEKPGYSVEPTWKFLGQMACKAVKILPFLRDLRVIRHWGGLYNMTPDAQPILGEVEGYPGFYQAVGFSGHGFMMAPIVGRLMAQIIVGSEVELDISCLDLGRFERGELIQEPSVV